MDIYYEHIVDCLRKGDRKSKTVKSIYERGYSGSMSSAFDYLKKVEQQCKMSFEPQPYIRTMTEALKYRAGSNGKERDYITRNGIFRFLWMNTKLKDEHYQYISEKYPVLSQLRKCIADFRKVFENKHTSTLQLFIQTYEKSAIKEISSFAKGLYKDIEAITHAVICKYSNGFVEGTNSK